MKLKSLIFVCSLAVMGSLFAGNRYVHSGEEGIAQAKSMMPGYCEIEIRNQSSFNVIVNGEYEDGYALRTFNIYRYGYDTSHFVSLYYNGYCHSYMYLDIETFWGVPVYMHRLVYEGTVLTLYDAGFDKQIKAQSIKK